jgi:threonine/homoserine/homoserine lactone efflux protein
MTPAAFLALSTVVLVAALTPGPAVTAIVARAITDGLRPAMAINAGVVTGDLLFLMLAIAGMAAAARAMGDLFEVLRVAGAAYLVWQGFAYWRTRPRSTPATGRTGTHERHFWRNYAAGLLLMFGHVQAMLFYAALLPGFVDLSTLGEADLLLLVAMLVVVIGGVNTGYALLASRARGFFADERAQLALRRVAGTLMFAAAALVVSR